MAYRSSYQSHYKRRRRRRNSHYGVLIALILVVLIAIPVTVRVVKGISGAVLGVGNEEVVFQLYNNKAFVDGSPVDLVAAPTMDESGATVVPLEALQTLGLETEWEQVSNTALIRGKKNEIRLQVGSKTMRLDDQTVNLSAAPTSADGVTYVPVRDVCEALSWHVGSVDAANGQLVIVSKSKKELTQEKVDKAAQQALAVLGPSRTQLMDGCILMRTDSDKLRANDKTVQMKEQGARTGLPVIEQEGVKYVPLKAAIEALGGNADVDDKGTWTVRLNEREATITEKGKIKVDGDTIKGDGFTTVTDEKNGSFYVSGALFAKLVGGNFTDLNDEQGAFAFTKMALDGFDSQKTYLSSLLSDLTGAVAGNVPDADVYIALTFDDGPTGALDSYPGGLTSYLLDGLQERGAHATFFMCGYRIKDFHSHMTRYLEEGHELGNHTMDHPDAKLTGIGAEEVRSQVASNSDLIESYCGKKPTVMRPVGGGVNSTVKEQMAALGLPIINWSVDTEDWRVRDASSVKSAIVNYAGDGDIVLMHDLYPSTVEGVLAAIDELQSKTDKTYAFVTVSELAAAKGITLEPGVVYNGLSDTTAQQIADGTYSPAEFS